MSKSDVLAKTYYFVYSVDILYQLVLHNKSNEEIERQIEAWDELEECWPDLKTTFDSEKVTPYFKILYDLWEKKEIKPTDSLFLRYLDDCSNDEKEDESLRLIASEIQQIWMNGVAEDEMKPQSIKEVAGYIQSAKEMDSVRKKMTQVKQAFDLGGIGAASDAMIDAGINLNTGGGTKVFDLNDEETLDAALKTLDQRIQRMADGTLNIQTGLDVIDRLGVFPQHGQVVGVMSTAGNFKSTFVRTLAYNAGVQGFNVLYYPLEITGPVESQNYIVQHAIREKPSSTLNRLDLTNGTIKFDSLAYQDYRWAIEDIKQRIKNTNFKLPVFTDFINRSNWSTLRKNIYTSKKEFEAKGKKLDMIVIDYLTLISKDGKQDPRVYMEEVIIDLARFAKDEDIMILTPIQANRSAVKNVLRTSIWRPEDIYNYSEIEKSFDLIYSVYQGDYEEYEEGEDKDGNSTRGKWKQYEMSENELRIGTVKTRSVPPIKPYVKCLINQKGGFVLSTTVEETEAESILSNMAL